MNGPARISFIVAVSAAVTLILGGCSAPVGGMTRADACRSVEASMSTVTAGLNSAFSNLTTDPTAAVKKLQDVTGGFHATVKRITNAGIKELGDRADVSLAALNHEVKTALADPKTADQASLEIASKAVDKDFTAIGEACT